MQPHITLLREIQIKPVSPWVFFIRLFLTPERKHNQLLGNRINTQRIKGALNYLFDQCFWLLSSDTPLQRGRVQIQQKNCRILLWNAETKTEIQNTASVSAWSTTRLNDTAPETESRNKPASLLGADDQLLLFVSFQHGCARNVKI